MIKDAKFNDNNYSYHPFPLLVKCITAMGLHKALSILTLFGYGYQVFHALDKQLVITCWWQQLYSFKKVL
ncbi:MAG: hypothetical protein QXT53_05500 [Ignisphaera sp.]